MRDKAYRVILWGTGRCYRLNLKLGRIEKKTDSPYEPDPDPDRYGVGGDP